MKYCQPDPNSCVPTTFAYLAYKQFGLDFARLLEKLLAVCTTKFDFQKDGMSFLQLKQVVEDMGFGIEVCTSKPNQKSYMVGVRCLPIVKHKKNMLIEQSLASGSLKISSSHFLYPDGHAVAIFEQNPTQVQVFDSFMGVERTLSLNEILLSLEGKPEFLVIVNYIKN